MTADKPKSKRTKKKKLDPVLCKVCNHNMGRSRCKSNANGDWQVRCNACKTLFIISISFTKAKE